MSVNITQAYKDAFIKRAHYLLFRGYQETKFKINANTDEDTITQYICESIRKLIRSGKLDEVYDRYDAYDQQKVNNTGKFGRNRKIIDIVVDLRDDKTRPEFICEAKRLKGNSKFSINEYVGVDGMGCFLHEEYAIAYNYGAMVGYMQSDDIHHWSKELLQQFLGTNRSDLHIRQSLSPHPPIVLDIPDEWASEHNRPNQPPILLYHIFFDCS